MSEQAWSEWSDQDERKREILGEPRVIAVVGMSPNRDRPSNVVARYLKEHGHTIIPVHPTVAEVEGLRAYPDLRSIPASAHVEVVDLFVAPRRTGPVVSKRRRSAPRSCGSNPVPSTRRASNGHASSGSRCSPGYAPRPSTLGWWAPEPVSQQQEQWERRRRVEPEATTGRSRGAGAASTQHAAARTGSPS